MSFLKKLFRSKKNPRVIGKSDMQQLDPETRAQIIIAFLGTLTAMFYATPSFLLLLHH